jgi:8-oxo-dGTP pyrophosphatase MutT (NUDIX family)
VIEVAMSEETWIPDGLADQAIEANWLFQLWRERFRSRASGKVHDYYVMHLADAVNVIALTDHDAIVLVRQFRAGSRHDSLEPPGGLLDPGEDPLAGGARELLEETGYVGGSPHLIASAWSNPSIMAQRIFTVLITGAKRVAEPALDHAEEVTIELIPAVEIPQMIRDGRIDHALAVEGLLRWLVSELPGPLALRNSGRRIWTSTIATLLWVVLLAGLVCGLIVNSFNPLGLGFIVFDMIAIFAGAVGMSSIFGWIWKWIHFRRQPTLVRAGEPLRRRGNPPSIQHDAR